MAPIRHQPSTVSEPTGPSVSLRPTTRPVSVIVYLGTDTRKTREMLDQGLSSFVTVIGKEWMSMVWRAGDLQTELSLNY